MHTTERLQRTVTGDVVQCFKYPHELVSETLKHKMGVFVGYNPRTKEWGYVANEGWAFHTWWPETARSFSEQQRGDTFKINFETVNRLNMKPCFSVAIKGTHY